MKHLLLSLTLILSANAWAEEELPKECQVDINSDQCTEALVSSWTKEEEVKSSTQSQENTEEGYLDALQERLELLAKNTKGIVCNFNTKRYIVVDNLDETSDEGEASNYWYISDSYILMRNDGFLQIMASLKNGKWIQPAFYNGKGSKVVVNENEISITQVVTENGLEALRKTERRKNLEMQEHSYFLERNTGRYFESLKMYLKEERVDNVTDEYQSRGSCSAIEPDKRKF